MKNIINVLQSNPIFRMSLGSKELFHSNFLEYLWYIDKDGFIEMINEWLPKEKRLQKNNYRLGREKMNFDLLIFHKEGDKESGEDIYDLVIENKVKSIPYKEQLIEYVKKAQKKKSNDYRFVLLTLTEDFPDKGDEEIDKNWFVVGYDSLKEGIEKHFSHESVQLAKNKLYIEDYCSFIERLIELKKTIIPTNILGCKLFEKGDIDSLKEIRLHDLYIKLRCSWFALTLKENLIKNEIGAQKIHIINKYDDRKPGINLNVNINQGNGQIAAWICDSREDSKDEKKGNTFEVVIQGDQYRHGVNQNSIEIENQGNEKLNNCYRRLKDEKNKDAFGFLNFDNSIKIYPNKEEEYFKKTKKNKESLLKAGPFCCYGDSYIYRYKKIEKENVADLLQMMVSDVLRIYPKIPNLL